MQRRLATLDDVAREAGVSQQTVSRVLNNPGVVSERTREKVIRAMQTLRYVPNRSAQLLAGKSAPSIGLITRLCRRDSMSFAPSIFAERLSACRWKVVLRSVWWRRIQI